MKNFNYFIILIIIYSSYIFIFYEKSVKNIKVENLKILDLIQLEKKNRSLCQSFKLVLEKYNNTKENFIYDDESKLSSSLAIFSMAYKYEEKNFKLFLESLKKTNYQGDIFMFTNDNITYQLNQYLLSKKVQPLFIVDEWPYYSNKNLRYPINQDSLIDSIPTRVVDGYFKFAMIRYSLLNVFLKFYGYKYKYGLMVDLKDIYFQINPFSWNIPNGISLFEESRAVSFKNSKANLKWVTSYNRSLTYYKKYYIINSGQIYFTYPDILYFLEEYNRIIINAYKLEPEQAIFNIIYYSSFYPNKKITVFPNYYGPVRLLAGDALYMMFDLKIKPKNIKYKDILDYQENYILNCDFTIPFIVHFWYFSKSEEVEKVIFEAINAN